MQTALRNFRLESSLESSALEVALATALQWQALNVGALKELVLKRQTIAADLVKAQKLVATLKANKAAGKTSNNSGIAGMRRRLDTKGLFGGGQSRDRRSTAEGPEPTIDDDIAKADKAEDDLTKQLDQHIKALWYCEFERYDAEHATLADLWARRFFDTLKQLAVRNAAVWDEAAAALGEPPDHAYAPMAAATLKWDAAALLDPDQP